MKISLEQNIWNGRQPAVLDLPDEWKVTKIDVPADSAPLISTVDIRAALENPIGMQPLSELAIGKKKVCIVFDDASRPTPAGDVSEVILEILLNAGVKKENIFFLCATGSHGVHNRKQFSDKLGEKILDQYLVLNHDCHEKCTSVGISKEGVEIKVNNEFLSSDLRIGIGSIIPHGMSGFSGGYRMLIPGLCQLDTIEGVHILVNEHMAKSGDMLALSGHKENMMMQDMISEMGRLTGEFFKIDCVVNSKSELVSLFAGDPYEEYKVAAEYGEKMYLIPKPSEPNADLVIANANSKVSYAGSGIFVAKPFLSPNGGDIVLVNFALEGQIPHYLRGYWGDNSQPRIPVIPARSDQKVIYYSPYGDFNATYGLHQEKATNFIRVKTWDEVLHNLTKNEPGMKVIVLSEATLAAI